MDIKIDGQTIKLTPEQAQQFKKAINKEVPDKVKVPISKNTGGFTLYHKAKPYALLMTRPPSSFVTLKHYPKLKDIQQNTLLFGRDFNQTEFQTFVKELKEYAKKIWPTFKV